MPKPPGVLTDEERFQVVAWLAEFVPPPQIPALVQARFGKTVNPLYGYHLARVKQWQPFLERHRQEWAADIASCPLAHKRYRLEKYLQLMERVESNPHLTPEKKEWRVLRILDRARMEMEEGKTAFTFNYFQSIQHATDEELLKRRDAIIARVTRVRWPTQGGEHANGMGHGQQVLETTVRETAGDDGRDGRE